MKLKLAWIEKSPWLWALLGSLLLWLAIGMLSKQLSLQSLMINATLATFLAVVGIGQMFTITGGGIDLSLPYVMTLAAFLSEGIMNGSNHGLVEGILLPLVIGAGIGLANAVIIVLLNIPPIVATLAMGYIVDTITLVYSNGFSSGHPSPFLKHFFSSGVLGIPWIVLVTAVLALVMGFVLQRSPYGRRLLALGQNERTARLAGIKTRNVKMISYVIGAVLASFGGVMLGIYSGGAFLSIGDPYLLQSIGAVVIGGTLIAGGRSTIIGTLGGALFLTLVNTMTELTKLSIGLQDIVEGALLILVLLVASRRSSTT